MTELAREMAAQYPEKKDAAIKEGFSVKVGDSVNSCTKHPWKVALYMTVIFLIVSAPFLYSLTSNLVQKINPNLALLDGNGQPTALGMGLHAVVFLLLARLTLQLSGK